MDSSAGSTLATPPTSSVSLDSLPPAAFFRKLYGIIPADSKFELRAKCPDEKVAHSAWVRSWDDFDLDQFGTGANIWYSAAYRQAEARRATLSDLTIAPLVWLDADKLAPDEKDDIPRAGVSSFASGRRGHRPCCAPAAGNHLN